MTKAPTVQDFFNKFSTDEACLEHLMMLRFGNPMYCPKCGAEGQFAKLKKLPAYACPTCGHHIHPMVGTPFERPLFNMCVMSPPLIITKAEVDDLVGMLRRGVERTMEDLQREGVFNA